MSPDAIDPFKISLATFDLVLGVVLTVIGVVGAFVINLFADLVVHELSADDSLGF